MFPRNRLFIRLFRYCCALVTILFLLEYFGFFVHPFEESFAKFKNSDVFFDGDIRGLCLQMKKGKEPDVSPTNNLTYSYRNNNPDKCKDELKNTLMPHLLIIVSY